MSCLLSRPIHQYVRQWWTQKRCKGEAARWVPTAATGMYARMFPEVYKFVKIAVRELRLKPNCEFADRLWNAVTAKLRLCNV